MKRFTRSSLFLALFILLAALAPTDERNKEKLLMQYLFQNLQSIHFNPLALDDSLSVKAFDLYLNRLDYGKLFLLQEDIDRISPYKTMIDDEIRQNSLIFFDITYNLIEKRIREAQPIYEEILAEPFDFERIENFQSRADSLEFSTNKDELRERWRLNLKYQTLTRLLTKLEQLEKKEETSDSLEAPMSYDEAEAWAREKVEKRYKDWFSRLEQTRREERLTMYINSIINVYDPHSEYFPPKAKEDFDIRFSGKLEGIGATLQQEDGYIKVARIVPGSASWRQGDLEVGDLILKVAQEGETDFTDIVDMRLDDAVRLIRGPKGTEVRLNVQKLDGTTAVIPIIRDVVELEETFAKAALIQQGDNNHKIGYIKLPSFYMDFNDPKGRSSAKDVLESIEALKAEGMEGLVFDLRNNGGGSLIDAVRIAGYFIEKGPVVQVKSRYGDPYIFDDKDSRVQYDGPLVVLVNAVSASASEIFAAAMQDYQRAIIIGSTRTFGKGTVQRFFELDKMVDPSYEDIKPLGSVKLTTQKFYRVNGDATQLKGVVPDLILPDRYAYVDIGEIERDYPMPWSEISPTIYQPWQSFSIDYDYLKRNESEKVGKDPTFRLLDEQARFLKMQRNESLIPLSLEQHKQWKTEREEATKKFKQLGKDSLDLQVFSLQSDLDIIEGDTAKTESTRKWHQQLVKDVYLFEAIHLLNQEGIVRVD